MKKILCVMAILACFAMVGCGDKEKNNNNENNSNTSLNNNVENNASLSNEQSQEIYDNISETLSTFDYYSDDTKYVFKTEENSSVTYYHNGNEITGLETVIAYEDNETARLAKEAYVPESGDNIESVTVEGNKVIVRYSQEEYEGTSLEEIRETFELLKSFSAE